MNDTESNQKILEVSEKLWDNLLSRKQFYAFEFLRNQTINDVKLDFYCPEASFAIRIENHVDAMAIQKRNRDKKALEDLGYKFIVLSTEEVLNDYEETVRLLDREFTSQTRFQCG